MMLAAKSMAGDTNDNRFFKKALRGVCTIICPNVCTPCHAFLNNLALIHGLQMSLDIFKLNRSLEEMEQTNQTPINQFAYFIPF